VSRCTTNSKHELIAELRAVFTGWDDLLAGMGEPEVAARSQPGPWSVSDMIAHLKAWQQVSIARLEAALRDAEPEFPAWLGGADPFYAEEHVDDFNARIGEIHRGQSWPNLVREWREGFLRLLELAEAMLFDRERYPWLAGYGLSAVLEGTCDHHREHLEQLSGRTA
jgi:hypothetical protein